MLYNFIGGSHSKSRSGMVSTVLDPTTGLESFNAPASRDEDIEDAFRSAREAFSRWSSTVPAQRSAALLALASDIAANADALVDAEASDTGKPVDDALAAEVDHCVDVLRFFAGAVRTLEAGAAGEYLPGHLSLLRREPVGVCAQITPWNFPLMMAVWKIAPALAAGNTTVLKPAETTPRSTLYLAELAARHLPKGVFNVVCGDRETGRAMVAHPTPAMVSFTGSAPGGREVAASAATSLKRVHLELGGNAAAVVFDDAGVARATRRIAESAFANAGQDCVAVERVLVHEDVLEEVVDGLSHWARVLASDLPRGEGALLGPLNNADQFARVTSFIEGLPTHARVTAGGTRVGDKGYYFAPTVVLGVRPEDDIVRQEVFGPVLTVQAFRHEHEAIALANGVEQGLASSVWTRDHARAMRVSAAMECGCVWINTHLEFAAEMPHGGVGGSGYGKDLSVSSLDDYTRTKHVMSDVSEASS